MRKQDDYTLSELTEIMSVKQIQEHLNVSKTMAYKIINTEGFPKIRIGHRFYIPKNRYIQWIDENIKHKIIV